MTMITPTRGDDHRGQSDPAAGGWLARPSFSLLPHAVCRLPSFSIRFLLAAWLLLGAACAADSSRENREATLFDFESEAELDLLHWECGAFMERDVHHAASGQYSLRVEMYPNGEYPGFKAGFAKGWQGYKMLSIDIYNPGAGDIKFSYRIDDRDDNPPFADRANGYVMVRPGRNTFSLDLENLKTSGTNRRLDLEKISSLALFVHQPPQKLVLYLDRVRLHDSLTGENGHGPLLP